MMHHVDRQFSRRHHGAATMHAVNVRACLVIHMRNHCSCSPTLPTGIHTVLISREKDLTIRSTSLMYCGDGSALRWKIRQC